MTSLSSLSLIKTNLSSGIDTIREKTSKAITRSNQLRGNFTDTQVNALHKAVQDRRLSTEVYYIEAMEEQDLVSPDLVEEARQKKGRPARILVSGSRFTRKHQLIQQMAEKMGRPLLEIDLGQLDDSLELTAQVFDAVNQFDQFDKHLGAGDPIVVLKNLDKLQVSTRDLVQLLDIDLSKNAGKADLIFVTNDLDSVPTEMQARMQSVIEL